jgi:diketogulonate reductase-like aldo/keto reductase
VSAGSVRQATAERAELHSIADRIQIAPSVLMPRLGVGTSHVVGVHDVDREIPAALELGYRLIDTASSYRNEAEIGQALKKADCPRSELFVTSKVWPSDQGYKSTLRAFEASRARLGLDYLDLYLIHWPEPSQTADTWRAFEELQMRGEVRAIGVSNFMPGDFEQLYQTANVPPAINQVEFHPFLQRPELLEYCREHGVAIEAWSPLIRGRVQGVPELAEIGERHGKTEAQVTIRWILQKGIVTIPKSTHIERLRENADVFDFSLSAEEMATIDALDRNEHENRKPGLPVRFNRPFIRLAKQWR